MNIYQIIKIGEHHVNFCEDYIATEEIGDEQIIAAVMDGCSMGHESYFASTIVGKILKKATKEIGYRAFLEKRELTLEFTLKKVFQALFQELNILKNQLQLEVEELLTTIVLLVIDKKERNGEVLVVGDGLIVCNNEVFEFDQDNKPDYLGYHLQEDFEKWFARQQQRLSLKSIDDISISTDGIFTFNNFDNKIYEACQLDLIDFLLNEKNGKDNPNMLLKKLNTIEEKWGLRPTDDLGIIRLIK